MSESALDFVHDLEAVDIPPEVLERARCCLLDLVGVAAAGSATRLSQIMRDHAIENHGATGRAARLLFDGRSASPVGAALANAATIDALDGHDGHRITKGHAGVTALPAALALVDETAASTSDLLVALVVGYEVANRAGMALHASTVEYHSSGAWNALGAAAVASRLLRLDHNATRDALGIAEYHAPRAPMMRCIDHPTMVKDSSAWGAYAGVSAGLLAAAGFTGAPAELLTSTLHAESWSDLGRRWTLLEQYVKPFAICRWAHPAVWATIELVRTHDVAAHDIERIEVATFHEATRLTTRLPATTEQAQYSLAFPVALAAVNRRLDPGDVVHLERVDAQVRRLATTLRLRESTEMTAAFPARRLADVTVVRTDQTTLSAGPTEAPGDPGNDVTHVRLDEKFLGSTAPRVGDTRARRILDLLGNTDRCDLSSLLAEVYAPAPDYRAPFSHGPVTA